MLWQASCTVEWGNYHYIVNVTYNGETHVYGDAGARERLPIYTSDITEKYLFSGSGKAPIANLSLDSLKEKLLIYGKTADERQRTLKESLEGAEFINKIGRGSWLRVGSEPYFVGSSPDSVYTYVSGGFSENSKEYVEDAWVDGRYVNKYNQFQAGAKFEEYPTADIILTNQSYTNVLGEQKQGDIHYRYDADSNSWNAIHTYLGRYGYLDEKDNLPDQFILTQKEAAELALDRNTDKLPESGLIYDSSVMPGTAFQN